MHHLHLLSHIISSEASRKAEISQEKKISTLNTKFCLSLATIKGVKKPEMLSMHQGKPMEIDFTYNFHSWADYQLF